MLPLEIPIQSAFLHCCLSNDQDPHLEPILKLAEGCYVRLEALALADAINDRSCSIARA